MNTKCYIIRCNEDGEVSLSCLAKDELEDKLNTNYWGDKIEFLNPNMGIFDLTSKSGFIIIRGESVVPQPIERVKTWSLG